MSYTKQGDYLLQSFDLPSQNKLLVKARGIHKERTGVHASIEIICSNGKSPDIVLAWGYCNTERDEDRTRLSRSALKHMPDEDADFPLKNRLDLFCHGLWEEHLQVYTAEEMVGAEILTSPCYFIKPFVIHGGGTILFGPPGRGKSFIAMLMAVSTNNGLNNIWQVTPVKTLYLNLERSRASLQQRLARINEFFKLSRTTPLLTFNARGRSLSDITDNVRRVINEKDVDFIILDSFSRAGFGSMVKDEDVNKCLDTLNSFDKPYLALAHSPRGSDEHVFGSQMYDCAADIIVRLNSQEQENELGITLKITKGNDVQLGQTRSYVLEFNEIGFERIRLMESFEFPDLTEKKRFNLKEEIQAYLAEVGKSDATTIAKVLDKNRSSIAELLAKDKDFVRLAKEGKAVIYGSRFKR